jgi:uncharacterized membrane protein
MGRISKKIREEIKDVRLEVRNRTITYIVAAFSLVAGLAWNDAIKSLIEYVFPVTKNGVKAKFIYATLITLVVVLATVYLMRMVKKDEKKTESGPGKK